MGDAKKLDDDNVKNNTLLFWGCFIALITTAFGFISRMFLLGEWEVEFGLDKAEAGRLAGIGIWPFAVSIIGFSLIIDKIGYKVAMFIAFAGHIIWAIMGVSAYFVSKNGDPDTAFQLLYWGSLILALGNGTVEAFINPVVATLFSKEKTKWLNILHAGWPGGLVIAGIIVIFMGNMEWGAKVGIIAAPALVYLAICAMCKFPVQERVSSGVTYKEMLSEFGIMGATIVAFLIVLQLIDFFGVTWENDKAWLIGFVGVGLVIVAAFGVYTQAIGRMLMFVLVLIMIPLATTEIGTDGWITGIMEGVLAGDEGEKASLMRHPGWILVYTSAIMMVLRFFAGPIVHTLSPLGLLTISAILAIAGLYTLSISTGVMIFVAATLYGVGKTFFWPTMLGVVAEQTPKGGAFTLNAISGIGMLAVGVLGFPYIGTLQSGRQIEAVEQSEVAKQVDGLIVDGNLTAVTEKKIYEIIPYKTIDDEKLKALAKDEKKVAEIQGERDKSNQRALADMAFFPLIMLLAYIGLIVYFRARGGYKAEVLTGNEADDDKFTGGAEGATK